MADRAAARRGSILLAVLVVLGAVALAGGAGLTWWTQTHVDTLTGTVTVPAKGSKADPLLLPVALLALAGLGAGLATTGTMRRSVGVVLVVGGGWTAVLAIDGIWRAPASLRTDLSRPVVSSAAPQLHALGPLIGTVGGLLAAAAGMLLVSGAGARKALGARYEAPVGRRGEVPLPTAVDAAADPDAAAGWWKALDAGRDPTAEQPVSGAAAPFPGPGDKAADVPGRIDPGVR